MRPGILRAALLVGLIGCCNGAAAASDSCEETEKTPMRQALCDIEKGQDLVAKAYQDVRDAYAAARARLSAEGQRFLDQDQEAWDLRTKAACVDHTEITASHHDDNYVMSVVPVDPMGDRGLYAVAVGSVNFCLFEVFHQRKATLESQPAQNGGFLWQRVDLGRDAYCDKSYSTSTSDNRLSFERSVWRIDSPINEATRNWNARHANMPPEEEHDACFHDGRVVRESYVTFAQGDFVALLSRDLVLYYDKSHDYIWGRPTYGKQAMRMSFERVSTGRPLGASDYFVTGSGWESFIGKRAYAEYLSAVKEAGKTPRRSEADYVAQAADVDHWSIDQTFAYEYGPTDIEDFGSSTRFTWKELRPYLKDDLPFRPDFD